MRQLNRLLMVFVSVGASIGAGCTDATGASAAANGGCPAGTTAVFDAATGKLKSCDANADGGNVSQADGGGGGDGGAKPDVPGLDAVGTKTDTKTDSTAATDESEGPDLNRTLTCTKDSVGNDKWFMCEPKPTTGTGLHGQPCTADGDCLYGQCMFGLPIVNYDKAIGVCTKNCGYVGGGSKFIACLSEDGNPKGVLYKCVTEKTEVIGNMKRDKSLPNVFKMCVRVCESDADCLAWNPDMPTCYNGNISTNELSTPPSKLCIRLPSK